MEKFLKYHCTGSTIIDMNSYCTLIYNSSRPRNVNLFNACRYSLTRAVKWSHVIGRKVCDDLIQRPAKSDKEQQDSDFSLP